MRRIMKVVLITGSAGLIGAESARFFANKGFEIVGIDNNMRKEFFGEDASTDWSRKNLQREITGKINIDWQYSINRVLKILTENGIDCLNTTGLLQESYSKGINPYKENDTHVNKTGNYIIFDNLRKKIHGVTIYLSP